MARFRRERWRARFEGMSRRDRGGCDYEVYLPDRLAGWDLQLPGELAADVADAEAAVRALNASGTTHVSLEGLARFLLRAESVASSHIEGLDAAPRRLARAEIELALGESGDRVALEVLGNIRAMEDAIARATASANFALDDVLAIHRTLVERSATPEVGGVVRETQNWIGGSGYNPCRASFVPPPPELVPELLDDLCAYLAADAHSPLVQAAIAHAQFETIHPFADGNGRTGRALIHVVLRRRGLAPAFVPPVSLVLATWSRDYVAALTDFRHTARSASPARSRAAHPWLRTFATAVRRSCADALRYASAIDALDARWRARLASVRAGSAADRLLRVLAGAPIVTVETAARLIDRSTVATGAAINRLVEAGILVQRNPERARYRVFEAVDVLDLFTLLERALASPTGDTTTSTPARRVPAKPRRPSSGRVAGPRALGSEPRLVK